ncbi:S49 family peptidase [Spirosoma oryzicola]|uniref:S49 family peptidase n=1 Tax=Spirosoma oryzicola TaxID=2898794 RepID=UPI001E52B43F|nr:S49 family peptidase [Spirosoma oryzicola]UHG93372.1 S49 family peptidase [Spirosoma oryzicola]
MYQNLLGVWAISEVHSYAVQAALQASQFKPYMAGHPDIPASAMAAAGFTIEGYYADQLSVGTKGDVVVIPVVGTMSRGYSWDNYFSNTFLMRLLNSIAENDAKKGVILDYNSGGGTVDSTDEFCASVAAFVQKKPLVSLVSCCASAALWSASPSNEIIMRPGPVAQIGSIGTIYMYTNYAKSLEQQGIDVRLFRSTGSVDKAKPNSIEPLDAKSEADIQRSLDVSNKAFKGAIRAGRGGKIKSEEIFTGKMYGADEAISNGLADRKGDLTLAYNRVISLSKNYV